MTFPSPPDLTAALQLDVGVLLAFLLMARLMSRDSLVGRVIFGGATATLIVVYLAWRWSDTLPSFEWSAGALWPRIFFAFETCAIVYTLISIAILLRWRDRSAEADRQMQRLQAADYWPPVDIFICTYNEPLEVIEKSIVLALAIDYPDFTVWVLDDTRRDWLRTYCATLGARYLTRPDNKGAKAGNLNNGLRRTARETNAPLILVLDADFAPSRNILRRTVGLFADPRAAIVQTPQFFYNADPLQHNLNATHAWVDDQRIFFDVFQPAKDAWGCAFCVGTSFVVRRDCLALIGGFPDSAICEDLNLTYQLMTRGFETHWLNEQLSMGLSAEGLPEYITQRTRWCLGTIQVALLPNGPLRGRGYSLMQRLHFIHGIMNWFCKPFVVLILMAPSLYWFFDLPAFHADYLTFLRYGLPALFALWIYGGWISDARTLPLFMEVTHTLPAPAISFTLLSAIVRPFGRPFKVTDKGGDRSLSRVRVRMAVTFGAITLLSGGSIVWSFISPTAASEISPSDLFNLIWAGVAMVLSFASFLVCFERPRTTERFPVNETAAIAYGDDNRAPCLLTELSTETAALEVESTAKLRIDDIIYLYVMGIGLLPARVIDRARDKTIVRFATSEAQRRELLVRLFSVPAGPVASRANFGKAVLALLRRSVAAE